MKYTLDMEEKDIQLILDLLEREIDKYEVQEGDIDDEGNGEYCEHLDGLFDTIYRAMKGWGQRDSVQVVTDNTNMLSLSEQFDKVVKESEEAFILKSVQTGRIDSSKSNLSNTPKELQSQDSLEDEKDLTKEKNYDILSPDGN